MPKLINKSPDGSSLRVGEYQKELIHHYLSYKMNKQNRKLVWATWGVAITTIILVAISLFIK